MQRAIPLAVLAVAVVLKAAAQSPATVVLEVDAAIVPGELAAGGHGELRLGLGTPEGIVLNRFPGITFTPEPAQGLAFDQEKVHVGSPRPAKNPEEFYFEALDPLVLGFRISPAASGTLNLTGELKYYYCVKKSGYCAPGKQSISVGVPVAAR